MNVEAALQVLRQFLDRSSGAVILRIQTADGTRLRLELPADRSAASPKDTLARSPVPFIPNPFQKRILEMLKGRALRTDALAAAVGDRSRLYRPGGIKELRERGMVGHHARIGYYRADVPPPELAQPGPVEAAS